VLTEPLESNAADVAQKCPNGSPAEIKAAMKFFGFRYPEFVDEVVIELVQLGKVEVIESDVLC